MNVTDKNHFEGGKNMTVGGKDRGPSLVETLPQSFTSDAGAGGGAAETLTVPGLKKGDELVGVYQSVKGGNNLPLLDAAVGSSDGELDCNWSADPGAGSVVKVQVRRVERDF